jgi:hypothetical protein
MTLLDLTIARRAERWRTLDPAEQRRIIQAHAYHLALYAEAVDFKQKHPTAKPPTGGGHFGSLDNIPTRDSSIRYKESLVR